MDWIGVVTVMMDGWQPSCSIGPCLHTAHMHKYLLQSGTAEAAREILDRTAKSYTWTLTEYDLLYIYDLYSGAFRMFEEWSLCICNKCPIYRFLFYGH